MYKVIVAHPHQQHSYQLATALDKAEMLDKYITTVYQKNGSFTALFSKFLKGSNKERALGRRNVNINDNQVLQYCELYGLFYLFLMRVTRNNKAIMDPYNRFVSRQFGKKVARYAIKNKVDAVICFDTECLELFKVLNQKAPNIIRIMDASAVNRLYLKKVYEEDMQLFPEFSERLRKERPELFSNNSTKVMKLLKNEIDLTNYFLVPSDLVKKSFQFSGVSLNQFIKCPYGVDSGIFLSGNKEFIKSGPLQVIYVGGIKELKGIGHLLKAFTKINPDDAILTVVGAGNKDDYDISPFSANIVFTGHVVHSKIPEILHKSDVFVFPSLGDSFGLAVLEAMACGLPAIVSENAGVSEFIEDGVNGFVISAFSVDEIVDRIMWFINHPSERIIMGKKALSVCTNLSWENYHSAISEGIKKCIS